jgi:hypothetical protein
MPQRIRASHDSGLCCSNSMVAVFYRHARDLGACDPVPVLKRNEFFFMLVTMLASTLDLRAYKLIFIGKICFF